MATHSCASGARTTGETGIIAALTLIVAAAFVMIQAVLLYFFTTAVIIVVGLSKLRPLLGALGTHSLFNTLPGAQTERMVRACELTAELTTAANMKPVALGLIKGETLNALSLDLRGGAQIALTSRALLLPDTQLRALLAHELGHIKAHDSWRALVRNTTLGLSTFLLWGTLLLTQGAPASIGEALRWGLLAMGLQFVANLLGRALSRRRENCADAFAASLTGDAAVVSLMEDLHAASPRPDWWWRLEDVLYTHPASHNRLARFRKRVVA